jgi:hypothetical protein
MARGDIYLGELGEEVLLPPIGRTFEEGMIEGKREDRTVSGRLVTDIYWSKKTFTLDYSDLIDGDVVEIIQTLYSLRKPLSLIVYYTDDNPTSYTVMMTKPIRKKRVLITSTNQLWSGVSVELEEV